MTDAGRSNAETPLDPIRLEILFNALRSVADETYVALMRSAYSTNIKERHDHSTAFVDPKGRLVVQAENALPIHLSSMIGLMECLLAKFPSETIDEGDLFVANDPHVAGGSHLPDINLAMPVFIEDELLGFMCDIAHHADVGGMAPGSIAGNMSEIYQEGLRIPVIRLFRKGELQSDIFDLLLLNVRLPDERRGDYNAQIAACRLGERRLKEVATRYSTNVLFTAFDEIISRTERRLRTAVTAVDDGTYRFEDVMDDDGVDMQDIPLKLVIEIAGDRIRFDFTGSSPQVTGNINVPFNATQAAVCYALKALLDPEVPNNQGVIDVCEIEAPRGSIVNCVTPAPVASRALTCQRVCDMIIGALADALPEAAVGASNGSNTAAVFSGMHPETGEGYVYLETLGGGFGGRFDHDGKDGVQVHTTNTSNLPVEAIEMEYPLLVERYELIPDSGGAGRFRGGLALRRVIRPVGGNCLFTGRGERIRHRPWGIFGGSEGASGRFLLLDGEGRETPLDAKPANLTITPDTSVVVETPGAGGYGSPAERSRDLLSEDRESGKFSESYIEQNYGDAAVTDD